METAQQAFKELLKTSVAPALRGLGFTGSGQSYSLKSDDYWPLLAFQKSMYSDAADLRFTINLCVISKREWKAEKARNKSYPEKPTATVGWGVGWQQRIGGLLPDNEDYWWSLDAQTDQQKLAEHVIFAIRNYALPAMYARMGK